MNDSHFNPMIRNIWTVKVYIDIDEEGFELAASVPASSVDRKKGPSVEWITRVVEKYLESR